MYIYIYIYVCMYTPNIEDSICYIYSHAAITIYLYTYPRHVRADVPRKHGGEEKRDGECRHLIIIISFVLNEYSIMYYSIIVIIVSV